MASVPCSRSDGPARRSCAASSCSNEDWRGPWSLRRRSGSRPWRRGWRPSGAAARGSPTGHRRGSPPTACARWNPLLPYPVHQGARGGGHSSFAVDPVETEEVQDLDSSLQPSGAREAAPPVHGRTGSVLPAQGRWASQLALFVTVATLTEKGEKAS